VAVRGEQRAQLEIGADTAEAVLVGDLR